MQISWSLASS